jgi:hypothetical protein
MIATLKKILGNEGMRGRRLTVLEGKEGKVT